MHLLTFWFAAYATISLAPIALRAQAASEIARQRQEMVDAILTSERAEAVAGLRWACFNGDEPKHVREDRTGGGFNFTPDAFDSCLAALRRKGRDHALLEAYKRLVTDLHGDPEAAARLPKAVGAAVLGGNGTVSIGNGKGVKVDAALAFDAGFTSAYLEAAPKKQAPDPQKVKAFTEGCLDEQRDAATCFSIGYVLGNQAVNVP